MFAFRHQIKSNFRGASTSAVPLFGCLRAAAAIEDEGVMNRAVGVTRRWAQQSAGMHFEPPRQGMFGIEGLRSPQDFPAIVQDAIAACQVIVGRVKQMPPSPAIVDAVDEISNTICQVLDPAELCRNVASLEWRQAATKACIDMESYVQILNSEPALYGALSSTLEAADRQLQEGRGAPFWESPEQEAVARALHRDFLLGGVQLPQGARQAVSDLKHRIHLLGMEFNQALADPKQLGVIDLSAYQSHASAQGRPVVLDMPNMSHILQHWKDTRVRQEVFMAGYKSPAANMTHLHEMIQCRHELAKLTGFKSFAAYTIQPYSLAKKPEAVWDFLTDLSRELRPLARQELRLLEQLAGCSIDKIPQWNRQYLMARVREKNIKVDPNVMAVHLPLSACLKGLGTVTEAVFGLRLVERELLPDEAWAPGVKKLMLAEKSGQEIGLMYLDAERRAHKCPHAAHFNMRSGRRLPPSISGTPRYQMPVVALVCNFESGRGLSLQELETLFHEFGHAMHSLLSATRYQHLAGTRGALDCTEVPSHLWQKFASEPVVLQEIAGHATSGPIQPGIISELRRSRAMFAYMDMQQQVVYSLMDQVLHGPSPPPSPEGTTQILGELMAEHMGMQLLPGIFPQARFSHFVGYGASYYSYLAARSVASEAWGKHFASAVASCGSSWPLSRSGGEAVRNELLSPGGLMSFSNHDASAIRSSMAYGNILEEILREKHLKEVA